MNGLRAAMRRSFTLWGGRYNPIIPIEDRGNNAPAMRLARLFRADALYAMSDGKDAIEFARSQLQIRWPMLDRALVLDRGSSASSSVVADLLYPMERLFRETFKPNPNADPFLTLHQWDEGNPLADVLLATFGGVPPVEECAEDYLGLLRAHLKAEPTVVLPDEPLPPLATNRMTFAAFNAMFMEQHHAVFNHWGLPGIFVGDSASFDDLVEFWNLRAAAIPLQFYDPAHSARLTAWRDAWISMWPTQGSGARAQGAAVWSREGVEFDAKSLGVPVSRCQVSEATWNGLNVRAPVMHFGEASALASVDRSGAVPQITFTLVDRPRTDGGSISDQQYVVSVDPGIGLYRDDVHTLHFPFMPELNEFYGRNVHYRWDRARSEPNSLGIIVSGSTDHLTLRAADVAQLTAEVFRSVGIQAKASTAGLVCNRLIRQMGGLDDCRVFRIGGVRDLIEAHQPDQSFTRSLAKQTILAKDTDHPLSDYQALYIEQRDHRTALTNDAIFSHLLKKEVFRPGLKLLCPSCSLDFWQSLDDSRVRTECEYCGQVFNLGPQLRDRDWAFRRSGLFGRKDSQAGALPVILTLQQLTNALDFSGSTFTTSLELTPAGADIAACETDFVLMPRGVRDGRIKLAIGECKTRQPITEQDVLNLRRVADAFPRDRFSVFIVFAKLGAFGADEVTLVASLNENGDRRAIMLTTRELEPWHIYERTEQEFEISGYGGSLEDMAKATETVFFDKR